MSFFDVLDGLEQNASGFHAEIPAEWRQGRSIFGGLQAALALRAMRRRVGPEPPLRTLQVTFVAPAPDGPVHATAAVLRRGKSATHAECRLLDGDQVVCLVAGIFGRARTSAITIEPTAPAVACEPESLADVPYIPDLTPRFTQFFRLRWCQGGPPFTGATEASTKVFVRLREVARDPEANLVAVADALPSPGISLLHEPTASSSLTWTLELLAPEAETHDGWYRLDTEVTAGRDGYLNQSARVWTTSGRLAALSHQSVAVFG